MSTGSATREETLIAGPFLKWAGGKKQVLPQLLPYFPAEFRRFYEPFAGGAAVFFSLARRRDGLSATLIDANTDLVNCYRVVRDRLDELLPLLAEHQASHSRDYYYAMRERSALPSVEAAARLLYLNKTCYNGLYRVNKSGKFNVPMGSYARPNIADAKGLIAANRALQGLDLREGDFSLVLETAGEGDFIYFDPPFVPLSRTANFTSYWVGASGRATFGLADQERLAEVFRELDRRGAKVVLSNSEAEAVRALYRGFDIQQIQVARVINSQPGKRGKVPEVVVRNFS